MLGGIAGSWNVPIPGKSAMRLKEVRLGPAYQVLWEFSEDPGHHRQMLQVVMSLEQRVALERNIFIRYPLLKCPTIYPYEDEAVFREYVKYN